MKLFSKAMFGFMFLALVPLVGFAQVVENDAVLLSPPGLYFDISDYELGLTQTTAFGSNFGGNGLGLFAFTIDALGNDQFQFDALGIAERYSLLPVEQGDLVTPDFVNSTTPFAANFNLDDPNASAPVGELTLEVGESVFLGYWDDRSNFFRLPGIDTADANDNFGWLELGRSNRADSSFGQLEILGGATAIGSGIIAGTTNTVAVPEPSSAMLIGLLGASGLIRRRR